MTKQEWVGVVQRIRANWPHAGVPDVSIAKWYDDLSELTVEEVTGAVEGFYRDGREFPPNSGQIIARLGADPDYSEAWRMAHSLIGTCSPLHEPIAFIAALEKRSPAAAEAVRRMGPREFGSYNLSAEPTVRAQFRGIYEAVCRDRRRTRISPALNRGSEPRSIGEIAKRVVE